MKLSDHIFCYPAKGGWDCNTYVIKDEVSVIIDPGLLEYLPALVESMQKDGIDPEDIDLITNTHLHLDHYWASEAFKDAYGAKIMMSPSQKQFYDLTVVQVTSLLGMAPVHIREDGCLNGKLKTGELEFEILYTPGHSPDSTCFYCKAEKTLICGDVVFAGNTGRVDFPGGSADQLKQSIEEIAKLSLEYLLPGHMGIVSGAEKVKHNFEFIRDRVFPWL